MLYLAVLIALVTFAFMHFGFWGGVGFLLLFILLEDIINA